jgi:hypothetical protein
MTQEIHFLPRPLSLSPIRTLIETSGFALDEIVVFFDFDQTLTQVDMIPDVNPKTGAPIEKKVLSIRGGDATRSFLNWLNENGIKWYVNTAAGPGGTESVATEMARKTTNIPFSPIMIDPDQKQCLSPKPYVGFIAKKDISYMDKQIGICNNIISAGFDKHIACYYVMSKMDVKPKLLIFVDDNAANIYKVYINIKDDFPEINFKGVVYEPYRSAEKEHEEFLTLLKENPGIQEINAEYGASGGRRRNRKSRRNRKNRRGTRRR